MKRRCVWLLLALLLCLFVPAAAEGEAPETLDELYNQQLEASGAEALFEQLPAETRRFLADIGITGLDAAGITGLQPAGLLQQLLNLFSEQAGGPIRACGIVLGIVLLCALMDGVRQTVREPAAADVFGVVCALAAAIAILSPVAGCIRSVCAATESTSVFMLSFVPVYSGVLLTTGQAATALSYNTIVLFVAELLSMLAAHVVVPLMTISLAMGLTGAVSGGLRLDAAGTLLHKIGVWLLGITTTIFVGLLSIQGIVGAAADTLGGRAIRFSLASFVPVVGGALGEAFNTVKGCLSLLKSTLGGFGILATAFIVLPPLLECAAWVLCLSICTMAADMFALPAVGAILKTAQGVVKTLIGVLSASALFMIVSTTIVTVAGNAAV